MSVEALCAINLAAVRVNAAMDAALAGQWGSLCVESDSAGVALDARTYARLPAELRKLAYRRALSILTGEDRAPGLSRRHYDQAANLAQGPVGTELSLPGGVTARREHGLIYLTSAPRPAPFGPLDLPVPGRVTVQCAGLSIAAEGITCPAEGQGALISRAGPREVFLSLDALELPLAVRSRRPGDRFHPLGAPGERRLKEFLIDRKVPLHERDRTPLVVDAAGRIAWIVGHAIADPFKLRGADARILHLSACPARP
jgi:tRNA(Ile)-lysidine synthase